MSANYEYLEKMFCRLEEARRQRGYLQERMRLGLPKKFPTTQAEIDTARNWILAIEGSIRDYLNLHT